MTTSRPTRPLKPCRLFGWAAIALALSSGPSRGEIGILPTRTGLFFDELRSRAVEFERSARGSESATAESYTFNRSHYRAAGPEAEGLTDPRRSIGQPYPDGDVYTHSQRYGRSFGRYAEPEGNQGGFFAPTYVTDAFETGKRNFKLGPIAFGMGLQAYGEYNDNIYRSGTNRVDDFIVGATMSLNGDWIITRFNRLSISAGVGYQRYLFERAVDFNEDWNYAFSVLPGTSIAFDILVGDTVITVYDRFSVGSYSLNEHALDPMEMFGVFENEFGVAATWLINSQWTLSGNLSRSDRYALNDENEYVNRAVYGLSGSLAWSPTGIWTAGLESSINYIDYYRSWLADGYSASNGVFFSTPITDKLSMRVAGGWQTGEWDEPAVFGDERNLSDYYFNASLQHQLNARFSHNLAFGHETDLGSVSNFQTNSYIRYGFGWVAYRGGRISGSIYYQNNEESGGFLREDLDSFGLDLYWGHDLTEWLNLGLGYHYGDISSSLPGRDYNEHSFSVDLNYPINDKLRASLGYRYWLVNSSAPEFDFDQNRVILSLSYQF